MLTAKQHELLNFIHERLSKTGVSPSFDEMREAAWVAPSIAATAANAKTASATARLFVSQRPPPS